MKIYSGSTAKQLASAMMSKLLDWKFSRIKKVSDMATRTFCDHCGCETPHLTVYCFGAKSMLQTVQYVYPQAPTQNWQLGAGVAPGNLLTTGQPWSTFPTPTTPPPAVTQISAGASVKSLDLCPACEPIWMKRVEKLATTTE